MTMTRRDMIRHAAFSAAALPGIAAPMRCLAQQATTDLPPTAQPFIHAIHQPFPGQPAIDIWGWTGTINYQRTLGHATPNDLIELASVSNRWGANMIEVMPFKIACGGYVMSWDEKDPIPKPDHGVYFYDDPNWSDDAYRNMFSQWHNLGMLAVLCVNSIGATWSELGPGWKRPTGNVEAETMERWARDFFNRFAYAENRGYFDVLDTERVSGMERQWMWTFNPSSTPLYTGGGDPQKEGFIYAMCCACRKRNQISGLDDRNGYEFKQKYPYFSYQADARTRKTLHSWGKFGGFTYPDWIVKQINDYCRPRKVEGNNLHTALWWFNDVDEMHAPIDEQYVHGASLDPLRSAIATRLFVTGQFNAHTAAMNPKGVGGLPERSHPRGTPMLHNNHLALYLPKWRQGGELVLDPRRLGEFHDRYDRQIRLTRRLLHVTCADATDEPDVLHAIESPGDDRNQSLDAALEHATYEEVAAERFHAPGGFDGPHGTHVHDHGRDTKDKFPGGMRFRGDAWPANIDLQFDAETGTHLLLLEVKGKASLEFLVNDERIAMEHIDVEAFGLLPLMFAVTDAGSQTLRMMCWDGELQFKRVAIAQLTDYAVGQAVFEPAGYLASWRELVLLPHPGGTIREERQFAVIDDGPWLELNIARTLTGEKPDAPILTHLGCDAYDTAIIDGVAYPQSTELQAVPDQLQLADSTGKAPLMHVALREKGRTTQILFRPNKSLTLKSTPAEMESLSVVMMLPHGLYEPQQIDGRISSIVDRRPVTFAGDDRLTVSNDLNLPLVQVLTLKGRGHGPFHVLEHAADDGGAWWMSRGVHSSFTGDESHLRVFMQPKRDVVVERQMFIEQCVRPGIGAQNIIAIGHDVAPDSCVVRVLEVTPYVAAPSVQFAVPITGVEVDGKPWHYFDHDTVYLPNERNEYGIRVFSDLPATPHVVSTQANITSTAWDNHTLTISAEHPPWYSPGVLKYVLGIHREGWTVDAATNGAEQIDQSVLRMHDEQRAKMAGFAVFSIRPGKTQLVFHSQ